MSGVRRANPAAGLASLVWLLIVVVPVYVMVNASFMPQEIGRAHV